MGKIAIIQKEKAQYPSTKSLFRPSIAYPEYLFPEELSSERNDIYELVRENFRLLALDIENINTPQWNPLREFISPGNLVLIKPNLVLDHNHGNGGEACLYTHPSIVAAIIDYVCIALQGEGAIIVADAPVQTCDFSKLIEESGYKDLIGFYKRKGIPIALKDLRGLTSKKEKGALYATIHNDKNEDGVCVDLGSLSAHANLSVKQIEAERITSYDPAILRKHHTGQKHEYLVSKDMLQADVIINIPKPKTHRKAGVTGALKNFVGINTRKEYLPHHRIGDSKHGGDEYLDCSYIKSGCARLLDKRNHLMSLEKYTMASILGYLTAIGYKIQKLLNGDSYTEGSWHGNDTIWRTILDLNRIVMYADKQGVMRPVPQRKIFCVGDMIITGEGEGPLMPTPKQIGVIAMGDNCVCFDEAVATIMGMDIQRIPSICNARKPADSYRLVLEEDIATIISNQCVWDGKGVSDITENNTLHIIPSQGWKGHIELHT